MVSSKLRPQTRPVRHARDRGACPEDKEPLQIRIPITIKRRFKSHAALRGLDPNELFVEVWQQYEASLTPEPTQDAGA
jgi:hypothetical protein